MIHPTTAPICLDDEIRFYYTGTSFTHGETQKVNDNPYMLGYASLRPDGFVSLEAGEKTATLLTRQFAIEKAEIYINADAANGYVKVEVCDGNTGEPLKGYELENSIAFSGDSIATLMSWKDCKDKEDITNRPIRIRLEAKNCKLFSIFMTNGNDADCYYEFDEISCVDPMNDIGQKDYHMDI